MRKPSLLIQHDETANIGGVDGKKVFIIDDSGNQITDFGGNYSLPTAEDFAKKYQQLCDEMGFRIVVNPAYIGRDDGTFSTQLQYSIGKLPEKRKS